MDCFREALEHHDFGFSGDVFTWQNKQTRGSQHIREWLDRAVANSEWREKFLLVHINNGDPFHSDHRPVIISMEGMLARRLARHPSAFKFEAS